MVAVEQWIDEIARFCGEIEGHDGKPVRSYRVFEKREFPESLTVFPCVTHYVEGVGAVYSTGGVCTDIWNGISEFHLTSNVDKSNLPDVLRYFARIRNAFAGHMRLNGKVAYCLLRPGEENIQGPVALKYGTENPHHGLIVKWVVKENVTGDFVVAG